LTGRSTSLRCGMQSPKLWKEAKTRSSCAVRNTIFSQWSELSAHEFHNSRPEALELLQHPARRRVVVRRLRRAVDLPAVPEDGGRAVAAAVQQAVAGAEGIWMADVA